LKLEQMGWIASRWTASETGRRVKVYRLTAAGRKQLDREQASWERASRIIERFLTLSEEEV
jgi:DNA-binding PadR family transcriptional regulator